MRILSVIVIAATMAPVVYVGSGFVVDLNDRIDQRKAGEAAVRKAARGVLDATGLRFELLVLGPGDTRNDIRFRARVSTPGDDSARSSHGVIDMTCDGAPAPPELSACWTLTTLFIDGAPAHETTAAGLGGIPLTAAAAQIAAAEAPKSEAPASETPASETLRPAAGPAVAAPKDEAPAAVASLAPETATVFPNPVAKPVQDPALAPAALTPVVEIVAAAPAIATSHEVQRSLVNARAGPSTGSRVRAQLTRGTALSLLEERGRWGFFRVLDGAEQDLEVWIAFSVLNAL